jgi:hypothetical protein
MGWASQTYTANPAAAGGPQFDYPKALKAVLLFIQLFVLTGLSSPRVVSHCIDFYLGVIICAMRPTMKILETINKVQLVPAHLQAINCNTPP